MLACSFASLDSQSVKTTKSGGPRGYDAGKKVKGRKRQVMVDQGNRVKEGGDKGWEF